MEKKSQRRKEELRDAEELQGAAIAAAAARNTAPTSPSSNNDTGAGGHGRPKEGVLPSPPSSRGSEAGGGRRLGSCGGVAAQRDLLKLSSPREQTGAQVMSPPTRGTKRPTASHTCTRRNS